MSQMPDAVLMPWGRRHEAIVVSLIS